jgi:putative hydrolase of the HAD superfamily
VPGIGAKAFLHAIAQTARVYWSDAERAHRGRLDLRRARREVVAGAFEKLRLDRPDLRDAIADTFTWIKEEAVAPFPRAVETLETLRQHGTRLALVSNGGSEFQRAKLKRYDLERFFEAVLIEGELGVGKPDPRVFGEALSRMGVSAEQAWMVGDNLQADVAGAQRSGMFAVWNDHAGAGLPPDTEIKPDRIIRHIAELVG